VADMIETFLQRSGVGMGVVKKRSNHWTRGDRSVHPVQCPPRRRGCRPPADQDVIRQAPREEAPGAPNDRDFRTMAGRPVEIGGMGGEQTARPPSSAAASLAAPARDSWRSHGKWRADRIRSNPLHRFAAHSTRLNGVAERWCSTRVSISEFPFHGNASAD
jgi:hypothetical protein